MFALPPRPNFRLRAAVCAADSHSLCFIIMAEPFWRESKHADSLGPLDSTTREVLLRSWHLEALDLQSSNPVICYSTYCDPFLPSKQPSPFRQPRTLCFPPPTHENLIGWMLFGKATHFVSGSTVTLNLICDIVAQTCFCHVTPQASFLSSQSDTAWSCIINGNVKAFVISTQFFSTLHSVLVPHAVLAFLVLSMRASPKLSLQYQSFFEFLTSSVLPQMKRKLARCEQGSMVSGS